MYEIKSYVLRVGFWWILKMRQKWFDLRFDIVMDHPEYPSKQNTYSWINIYSNNDAANLEWFIYTPEAGIGPFRETEV